MLKALLVDDFAQDRKRLREYLTDREMVSLIEVVGESEDGQQALDWAANHEADLVITDVEMPLMNGMELARSLRQLRPEMKIIFCTMHNHFQLVREAMYLGGYGYVLKPIEPEELYQAIHHVTRVVNREEEEQRQREEMEQLWVSHRPLIIESLLKDILLGINRNEDDIRSKLNYFKLPLFDRKLGLIVLEIDDFERITGQYSVEGKQLLSHRVNHAVREGIGEDESVLIARISDHRFALIHSFAGDEKETLWSSYVNGIHQRIINHFKFADVSLTMAASMHTDKVTNLHQLLEQCMYTLRYKYSLGKGQLLMYSDLPEHTVCVELDVLQLQQELKFMLNTATQEEISEYMHGLFDSLPQYANLSQFRVACMEIFLHVQLAISAFKSLANGALLAFDEVQYFETAQDVRDWIIEQLLRIHDQLRAHETTKNSALVERVKELVALDYGENLTLVQLAAELHYSPNYINLVFKKEEGMTIPEYVLYFRMEKAKEMLEDEERKLYEIAGELGYTHTAYFSKLFKKHTGLTPKEYRERRHSR